VWLSIVAFGGGFAVANRVRQIVVDERKWMTEDEFGEHFAVAGALPGTMATNLLSMLGLRFRGIPGAAVCAAAFLLPSLALMIAFGAEYERIRGVTALASFLDGMSYATVGVVGAVAVEMRRVAVRTRLDFVIAGLSAVTLSSGALDLLEVVACSGLVGMAATRFVPDARLQVPDASHDTVPPASRGSGPCLRCRCQR